MAFDRIKRFQFKQNPSHVTDKGRKKMENEISIVTKQEAADRRSFHVQRINGAHQKTVVSIIKFCRCLKEAEEELGRDAFIEMVNSGDLGFKQRTADKYKAISKNKRPLKKK